MCSNSGNLNSRSWAENENFVDSGIFVENLTTENFVAAEILVEAKIVVPVDNYSENSVSSPRQNCILLQYWTHISRVISLAADLASFDF